ncbi:hypothetical protein K458DRAFT_491723 [Lentithecium fluviatile CBS 122367]|uniref:Uncharacterized protein n=1 Tax=Lentithecium fluviatile CBS 122367 TaxID=1168545 RepID=A0A6G1IHG9_9PLEO|nr:hypothetical protein K458DRAFT_491723 [Lentithecium fluviatile CBS 122367]
MSLMRRRSLSAGPVTVARNETRGFGLPGRSVLRPHRGPHVFARTAATHPFTLPSSPSAPPSAASPPQRQDTPPRPSRLMLPNLARPSLATVTRGHPDLKRPQMTSSVPGGRGILPSQSGPASEATPQTAIGHSLAWRPPSLLSVKTIRTKPFTDSRVPTQSAPAHAASDNGGVFAMPPIARAAPSPGAQRKAGCGERAAIKTAPRARLRDSRAQ